MAVEPRSFSGVRTLAQSSTPKHRFSLNVSERKLLLGFSDILLLNIAFVLTFAPGSTLHALPHLLWKNVLGFVTLSSIWFMWATTLQIYTLSLSAQVHRSVGRASIAAGITTVLYIGLTYTAPDVFPMHHTIILPALAIASIACWRTFYALVLVQTGLHHRALLIGTGRSGQHLANVIKELSPNNGFGQLFGYHFIGVVSEQEQPTGSSIAPFEIGKIEDLHLLIHQLRPHELILSDEIVSALTHAELRPGRPQRRQYDMICISLFNTILECRELGIAITSASTVYEYLTNRVPVEQIGRSITSALPLNQSTTYRLYLTSRRLLDIAVSLVGCCLVALVLPWIWLANALTSPGPLFYRQERVGEGGRTFDVLKFRSMRVDAEQHMGAVWASEDDPRITRVGVFLRKTRLDEVPQFWNILRGDMSFIGPRPERPYFVNQLAADIPFYRARHALKPGLTGWAQVCYRYGASVEDSLMKLQYDLYYIKHVSPLMDLKVVLLTLPVIFGLKGR